MIVHARTKIGIVCGLKNPAHAIDFKKFFHVEPASRCKECSSTLATPVAHPSASAEPK